MSGFPRYVGVPKICRGSQDMSGFPRYAWYPQIYRGSLDMSGSRDMSGFPRYVGVPKKLWNSLDISGFPIDMLEFRRYVRVTLICRVFQDISGFPRYVGIPDICRRGFIDMLGQPNFLGTQTNHPLIMKFISFRDIFYM